MNDCALWCDGVWTWKEYTLIFIPFISCAITIVYASYCDCDLEKIIVMGIVSFFIGALVSLIAALFLMAPPLFVMALFACITAFISYFMGKLARLIRGKF